MADIVKALYNCAFSVWNALIEIAMTLFTTSPKTAGGGTPYNVVHTWYIVIDPSSWSFTIYISFLSTFNNRG